MIKIHHLEHSRSQRILWLLEELSVPYEIVHYKRHPETMLGPDELRAIHPLGKSPILEEGDVIIAETGAIIEYIIEQHGGGHLKPPPGTPEARAWTYRLHYAEGSAMLPLMLQMYVMRLGEAGAPLHPRIESEVDNHLSYIDQTLAGRDYLMGQALTGADIQMSFVGEVARAFGKLQNYPNAEAWLNRLHGRPAYKAAIERGGPYALGR